MQASIFSTVHCTVNFAYFVNTLLQSVLPLVTYCSLLVMPYPSLQKYAIFRLHAK
jgi:hypothetical protein